MGFPETFKALSSQSRRDILHLLKSGSLSVSEIGSHFTMTGATLSHHLAVLREAGLITDRRRGKYIYYELNLTVFEEIAAWMKGFIKNE